MDGVATEVFSVVTKSFWFCVATVDGVEIGCGQGREALCRDGVALRARISVRDK